MDLFNQATRKPYSFLLYDCTTLCPDEYRLRKSALWNRNDIKGDAEKEGGPGGPEASGDDEEVTGGPEATGDDQEVTRDNEEATGGPDATGGPEAIGDDQEVTGDDEEG